MKRAHLLLVEDEIVVAMPIEELLLQAGFDVSVALDGFGALAEIEKRTQSFRVLVTDIALPNASGWDVARRAREINPAIAVIYYSGHRGVDWDTEGVPGSVKVQKPFTNAQLVLAVGDLFQQTKDRALAAILH